MTRVTSFGIKRTYVEAGFDEPRQPEPSTSAKKKSKRPEQERKAKSSFDRKSASETRRQGRIAERQADTICFACREKGHAARDCPTSKTAEGRTKNVVGICYRCGSNKHSLTRCRKQVDESNPMPFASCFVCSKKGHLASKCPENQHKGVYPNGGSCKLCGDTAHLAKDCNLRRQEAIAPATVIGTGRGDMGADEDDFHSFKRRKTEVEVGEKKYDKMRRLTDLKVGMHSGSLVKPAPVKAPSKTVVFF